MPGVETSRRQEARVKSERDNIMCNLLWLSGSLFCPIFSFFGYTVRDCVTKDEEREKFFKIRLGKMFASGISKLGKTSDGRTNKEYRYSALFECGR